MQASTRGAEHRVRAARAAFSCAAAVAAVLAVGASGGCSSSSSAPAAVDSGVTPPVDAGPSCASKSGLCLVVAAPRYGGHCPAGTAHVASGDCGSSDTDCCVKTPGANVPTCAAAGGQCAEVPLGTCGGGTTHVDSSDCIDSATHDCCIGGDLDAGTDSGSDSGRDAASDSGSDAGADSASDAATD